MRKNKKWIGMTEEELRSIEDEERKRILSSNRIESRVAKRILIEIELEKVRRYEVLWGLEKDIKPETRS